MAQKPQSFGRWLLSFVVPEVRCLQVGFERRLKVITLLVHVSLTLNFLSQGVYTVQRASTEKLQAVFNKVQIKSKIQHRYLIVLLIVCHSCQRRWKVHHVHRLCPWIPWPLLRTELWPTISSLAWRSCWYKQRWVACSFIVQWYSLWSLIYFLHFLGSFLSQSSKHLKAYCVCQMLYISPRFSSLIQMEQAWCLLVFSYSGFRKELAIVTLLFNLSL